MKNKLIITKKIEVTYDAKHWELYMSMGVDVCNIAATALNYTLEKSVNAGLSRHDTQNAMHAIMREFEDVGAYDTEPLYFLEYLLDKIYDN